MHSTSSSFLPLSLYYFPCPLKVESLLELWCWLDDCCVRRRWSPTHAEELSQLAFPLEQYFTVCSIQWLFLTIPKSNLIPSNTFTFLLSLAGVSSSQSLFPTAFHSHRLSQLALCLCIDQTNQLVRFSPQFLQKSESWSAGKFCILTGMYLSFPVVLGWFQ